MDRRAPFFLVFAVIGFALVPAADADHRWVAVAVGCAFIVLAGLTALDSWSRHR